MHIERSDHCAGRSEHGCVAQLVRLRNHHVVHGLRRVHIEALHDSSDYRDLRGVYNLSLLFLDVVIHQLSQCLAHGGVLSPHILVNGSVCRHARMQHGLVNERECQHKARCHVPGQTLLASQGWSSVMCSRCLLMAFGPLPTSSFAVPWATILLAD